MATLYLGMPEAEDVDTGTPDTGGPTDTAVTDTDTGDSAPVVTDTDDTGGDVPGVEDSGTDKPPGGCGCATGTADGPAVVLGIAGLLLARRRR